MSEKLSVAERKHFHRGVAKTLFCTWPPDGDEKVEVRLIIYPNAPFGVQESFKRGAVPAKSLKNSMHVAGSGSAEGTHHQQGQMSTMKLVTEMSTAT